MQIVIDISEKTINEIKDNAMFAGSISSEILWDVTNAIVNGTPLPKGHGRLKDVDKIDEDRIDHDNPVIYLTINGEYIEAVSLDYLNSLPTIIEADKAERIGKE